MSWLVSASSVPCEGEQWHEAALPSLYPVGVFVSKPPPTQHP